MSSGWPMRPAVSVRPGLTAFTWMRRSLSITHRPLRSVKIFSEKVAAIVARTETAPHFI
jgi:hypothetical protein